MKSVLEISFSVCHANELIFTVGNLISDYLLLVFSPLLLFYIIYFRHLPECVRIMFDKIFYVSTNNFLSVMTAPHTAIPPFIVLRILKIFILLICCVAFNCIRVNFNLWWYSQIDTYIFGLMSGQMMRTMWLRVAYEQHLMSRSANHFDWDTIEINPVLWWWRIQLVLCGWC